VERERRKGWDRVTTGQSYKSKVGRERRLRDGDCKVRK
jgi:hypothetical protein